jgi:hypothetical protein
MSFFWVGHFEFFFQKKNSFLLHLNENKQPIHMKNNLFLQYGWFLQNLGKDFIRTNMHTTVEGWHFHRTNFLVGWCTTVLSCPKKKFLALMCSIIWKLQKCCNFYLVCWGGFQNKYHINIKKKAYFPQRVS